MTRSLLARPRGTRIPVFLLIMLPILSLPAGTAVRADEVAPAAAPAAA